MPIANDASKTPLPAILREAFATGTVYGAHGPRPLHAAVPLHEVQLLYDVCRELAPQQSLELGFAQGLSTLAILQALENNGVGHHHVVDPTEEDWDNAGPVMTERAGLAHRMTFYPAHLEEIFTSLPALDFAFIDASHLFDLTLLAFALIDRKLRVGGIIGFHDLHLPSQRQALRYILTNRAYVQYRGYDNQYYGMRRITAPLLACLPNWLLLRLHARSLNRWSDFAIPNLALIQKTGDDQRTWDFHVPI